MSLEQNNQYINVHKLLEIESNENDKSLKESVENIFKNYMYQNDIETVCGCINNQIELIKRLQTDIRNCSKQLNERISECNKLKTNYTIQTQKLVERNKDKTIAIIILSITIGLMIPLITCL